MGLAFLEIEVGNPSSPDVTEKIEFLIDSGAVYSVVPAAVLEDLGIKPLAEQEFRLADGSKITRKKVARFSSTASSSGLRMSYLVRMETVSC